MSFNPGGGGGIAAASDISFSNLSNNQTLVYKTAADKWSNDADRQSVIPVNQQTGISYTLVLSDMGGLVTRTNAAASTVAVPNDSQVNFPIGARVVVVQMGSGQVTLAGASGVTVSADPGLKIAVRYGAAELIKLAANNWLAVGRLAS